VHTEGAGYIEKAREWRKTLEIYKKENKKKNIRR
jgi:hypothetical protein